VRVEQQFAQPPAHVAIRAHHVRIRPSHKGAAEKFENEFPCWMAAMAETPFRVTLDLRIGAPPKNAADFHVQAEIFKAEWELFRELPQPWSIELAPDRLFLLPD